MMAEHDTYECKGLCNDCRYHTIFIKSPVIFNLQDEKCDLHFPIKTMERDGQKITRPVGSYIPNNNEEEIAILEAEDVPIERRK